MGQPAPRAAPPNRPHHRARRLALHGARLHRARPGGPPHRIPITWWLRRRIEPDVSVSVPSSHGRTRDAGAGVGRRAVRLAMATGGGTGGDELCVRAAVAIEAVARARREPRVDHTTRIRCAPRSTKAPMGSSRRSNLAATSRKSAARAGSTATRSPPLVCGSQRILRRCSSSGAMVSP